MKKLVILLLLAGIASGQAQVIKLDEARVEAKAIKIITKGGNLKYVVLKEFSGEFMKNPLSFMKENFDINPFMEKMKGQKYDSFMVEFKNSKGHLEANFDRNGTLVSTSQKFKNIQLPLAISRELVTKHNGWSMTKNLYIASGKNDVVDKEVYRITLKNGKKSRNVKIVPDRSTEGLVSN